MTDESIDSGGSLQVSRENLLSDLKNVLGDASDLAKQSASSNADESLAERAGIEEKLAEVKTRISNLRKSAAQTACRAGCAANAYIRNNPWKVISCGALAGVVVALLVRRR